MKRQSLVTAPTIILVLALLPIVVVARHQLMASNSKDSHTITTENIIYESHDRLTDNRYIAMAKQTTMQDDQILITLPELYLIQPNQTTRIYAKKAIYQNQSTNTYIEFHDDVLVIIDMEDSRPCAINTQHITYYPQDNRIETQYPTQALQPKLLTDSPNGFQLDLSNRELSFGENSQFTLLTSSV